MKKAILLHGWNTEEEFFDPDKPTASNDHWFPWLTKQLVVKGYKVDVPEMTQYSQTTYESWKTEFERFDITPETLLVGHSCGGGFIVRYLTENDIRVGKVILVAPWMGIDAGAEFDPEFFSFTPDGTIANKTESITVMYSDDDFESIQKSVNQLQQQINGIQLIELHNKGHFTLKSLGTTEFPELLTKCLR